MHVIIIISTFISPTDTHSYSPHTHTPTHTPPPPHTLTHSQYIQLSTPQPSASDAQALVRHAALQADTGTSHPAGEVVRRTQGPPVPISTRKNTSLPADPTHFHAGTRILPDFIPGPIHYSFIVLAPIDYISYKNNYYCPACNCFLCAYIIQWCLGGSGIV